MPTLNRSDVHVNRPLTNFSVAQIQESSEFSYRKLFGVVPVQKQADRYVEYTRSYWNRTAAAIRAPATESAGSGFHLDNTKTYFCSDWSFHQDVDDNTRDNADSPISVDEDATRFVTRNLELRAEKNFAASFLSPNTWKGNMETVNGVLTAKDYTPAGPEEMWDDPRSNPMKIIAQMRTQIKRTTGFTPNKLGISFDLFEALCENVAVLDRIKYTSEAVITEAMLARLFKLDELVVFGAIENTAEEGQVEANNFITSNKFLLCYSAPNPGIRTATAGVNFAWKGLPGADNNEGMRIETIRMPHLKADRIEGTYSWDQKIVCADMGVLGTGLISTPV